MSGQIWVAVADAHAGIRAGLRRYLQQEPDMCWAGEASEAEEAIMLSQMRHVDVLVLDLSMPGMGGVAALPCIKAVAPDVRVMEYTALSSEELIERAFSQGACAYPPQAS